MRDPVIAANRFGLGARAGQPLPRDGERWLLDQFARYDARPASIAAAPSRVAAAQAVADYAMTAMAARQAKKGLSTPAGAMPDPMTAATPDAPMTLPQPMIEARKAARQALQQIYCDSIAARAQGALVTDTPFVERMVYFWSNHFAVSAEKAPVTALAGSFEFDAIRPHVLGRFADMLGAVERHPAMLVYLDQAQSIGPDSIAGQRAGRNGRKRGLNENLGREIMELHTLGARTGYGQGDVTEFARALTGWTVGGLLRGGKAVGGRMGGQMAGGGEPGRFVFAEAFHEPGTRTILGKRYAEDGEAQADAVLAMLAAHPATARHVATKLARHFAGDTPPPALVARLERAFLSSGGDLPTVYRALIAAPEAWAPTPAKFKSPWEWAISAGRATGAESFPAQNVAGLIDQLGQRIWRPGSPAGYDDTVATWAGPDAILRRVEAADRLAGRNRQAVDARTVAASLFGTSLTPATAQAIARAESPAQGMALLLVSPDFLRR